MTTTRRSLVVGLGAVAAVVAVVLGTTMATGGASTGDDPSAAGLADRAPAPVAPATGSDDEGAPDAVVPAAAPVVAGSLLDVLPVPPAAAADPASAELVGTPASTGDDVVVERLTVAGTDLYRVTVTAGPYVMRDMPAIFSLDGAPLGVAAESADLASLVLYTSDTAVTRAGATLALSYGLPDVAGVDWSATLEVAR